MQADVDIMVIGAGVVGMACAARLARMGRSVVLVERHDGPGRETSSRNSGVIHAGLYYPIDSLKGRLCVEGRERLYARCEAEDIPHEKTGKLVIAVEPAEVDVLERMLSRGRTLGAGALEIFDASELVRREPTLRGVAALWSPESGIVDAHGLLDSLRAEATSHGADFAWHTEVTALSACAAGWRVTTRSLRNETHTATAQWIVNAAGLSADRVALLAGIDIDARRWRQHPCKGDYFTLASSAPRPQTPLVYPVPAGPGLGIHLTSDLGGRRIAGPDATYVDCYEYDVDESKAEAFATAVSRYLPGVRAEHLTAGYSGIRPKLQPPGGELRDFVIEESSDHGAPNMVHLVGIESPGLTASLAIAERVAALLA